MTTGGACIQNADRIHAECQERAVGIPHFLMELGMLRGLKRCAERAFGAKFDRISTTETAAA